MAPTYYFSPQISFVKNLAVVGDQASSCLLGSASVTLFIFYLRFDIFKMLYGSCVQRMSTRDGIRTDPELGKFVF